MSVDPATKKALRSLADAEYGGNLSALVTALAEEARRRTAAAAYLRKAGIGPDDSATLDALQTEIDREVSVFRRRRRARRAA